MAAGLFGYLGYDMVRLVEHLPHVNPDPLGLPDALMLRPSVVLVVDGVKGEVTVVSPAWANSGLNPRAAYAQAAERVMDAVRDLDRTPPAGQPRPRRPRPGRAGLQHQPRPLPRDGRAGEGVHPRRRHLPGRPHPALGAEVRPAALRPLPRAPPDEPQPLTCSTSTSAASRWSAPAPRSSSASRATPSPSARSPAPARAAPRRSRTSRSRPSSSPTPRSAPSTSCSSTSAATTSAASRRSAPSILTSIHHRAL